MFIDQKQKNEKTEFPDPNTQESEKKSYTNAIIIVLVIISGITTFLYFLYFKSSKHTSIQPPIDQAAMNNRPTGLNSSGLPIDLSGGNNGNADIANMKAEDLTFAQFYKKIEDDFELRKKKLGLPINIKTDVANYYSISRKINLDPYINTLNNDGFAILDNPISADDINSSARQIDNFYSAYEELNKKDIPSLITSDFLIYYYQNNLKNVFKEIEKDIFYEDLWEINEEFYKISESEYRERRKQTGIVNDPILEGLRLKTAYFAIVLELLKAKPGQIAISIKNNGQFTENEAINFEFNAPAYLQEDIAREINLINEASDLTKSPILLYQKNYTKFIVPEEYKNNAKLNNYFLASKWLNSVFPLYYKDDNCADCLLDKDDWLINMFVACSIAKDFSQEQELKNRWAKIYKIISFFTGLKRDLIYLHYHQSLIDLFGDDYAINKIFSQNNALRDDNLLELRKKIAEYKFSEIEGGINRNDSSFIPVAGLKMLQDSYWPNDYIFRQLTYPNVLLYNKKTDKKVNLITKCDGKSNNRCKGIGLDIVNLIYPISKDNNYFSINANYQNYDNQTAFLKNQINSFNIDSWHNNNFWSTLHAVKLFLEAEDFNRPIFIENDNWQNKNINTALAAWVNLQLPADKLNISITKGSNNLTISTADNIYSYVESDLIIINELISNTDMLSRMLTALKATGDYEFSKLNSLSEELNKIKKIIVKELNNEILDFDDTQAINNFAKQYIVTKKSSKSIDLSFKNSKRVVTESINGIKLLIIVYNRGDKKFFAVGPIFNYQER